MRCLMLVVLACGVGAPALGQEADPAVLLLDAARRCETRKQFRLGAEVCQALLAVPVAQRPAEGAEQWRAASALRDRLLQATTRQIAVLEQAVEEAAGGVAGNLQRLALGRARAAMLPQHVASGLQTLAGEVQNAQAAAWLRTRAADYATAARLAEDAFDDALHALYAAALGLRRTATPDQLHAAATRVLELRVEYGPARQLLKLANELLERDHERAKERPPTVREQELRHLRDRAKAAGDAQRVRELEKQLAVAAARALAGWARSHGMVESVWDAKVGQWQRTVTSWVKDRVFQLRESRNADNAASVDRRVERLTALLTSGIGVPGLDAVEQALAKAEAERDRLWAEEQKLTSKRAELEREIRRLRIKRDALHPRTADVPHINGMVVGVMEGSNLVALNVGEGDQTKVGYEFTIYRAATYVGRVRVVEVWADSCGAEILQEYSKYPIKRGDEASTRVE